MALTCGIAICGAVVVLFTASSSAAQDTAPRQQTEPAPSQQEPDPSPPQPRARPAQQAQPPPQQRQAEPPPAQQAGTSEEGTSSKDEELFARAIERALVQRGALLLPAWHAEVVPALAYGHASSDATAALVGGGTAVGRIRAHLATASLGARLGLPAALQIETAVPFVAAQRRITVGGSEQRAAVGPGIGDLRVVVTKHVLSANSSTIQLLLAGAWSTPTGKSPYQTPLDELGRGAGVHALSGSATIVKISDPLVLLATGTYTATLPSDTPVGRIDVSDTVKLSLSSLLAITPQESLSLEIDVERGGDLHLNGAPIIGTDRTSGVLQVGLSTVLSPRVLLTVAAGLGFTADAPDLQLMVSVPVRF